MAKERIIPCEIMVCKGVPAPAIPTLPESLGNDLLFHWDADNTTTWLEDNAPYGGLTNEIYLLTDLTANNYDYVAESPNISPRRIESNSPGVYYMNFLETTGLAQAQRNYLEPNVPAVYPRVAVCDVFVLLRNKFTTDMLISPTDSYAYASQILDTYGTANMQYYYTTPYHPTDPSAKGYSSLTVLIDGSQTGDYTLDTVVGGWEVLNFSFDDPNVTIRNDLGAESSPMNWKDWTGDFDVRILGEDTLSPQGRDYPFIGDIKCIIGVQRMVTAQERTEIFAYLNYLKGLL